MKLALALAVIALLALVATAKPTPPDSGDECTDLFQRMSADVLVKLTDVCARVSTPRFCACLAGMGQE